MMTAAKFSTASSSRHIGVEWSTGVPATIFADNRKRFLAKFKEQVKSIPAHSVLFLKGKEEIHVDSTGKELCADSRRRRV